MQKVDTSLATFEFSSIAYGYRALDIVTRSFTSERVIEASPIGAGRFLILLQGGADRLREIGRALQTSFEAGATQVLLDHAVIDQDVDSIANALYSLTQVKLDESLVVVECETVSALLSAAQALSHDYKLNAIEIKIHRAGAKGGYAFFTGTSEASVPAVEGIRTLLKNAVRNVEIEVIERPVVAFREYFNPSGEA